MALGFGGRTGMARGLIPIALGLAIGPIATARGGPEGSKLDPAQVEFFESKVRPVLANRCVSCHGPEKHKGGLRLDSPDAMRAGGDSGPAVVPGDPDASPLVEAIRYDGEPRMPPKGKLADAEIAALTEWVKRGAPWPAATPENRPATAGKGRVISEADRAFWSFRPVADPSPPTVANESWPQSSIDRFILAALEAKGLRPSPPANKRTLIRRATFDLTGLPPTPDEIDAFLADEAPGAFARVVDRLLASPHYGERWGRHWLDVARYGEDQAHSFQPRLYPHGYRYRDWVVSALNADMPYDRFIVEQVAGDLLDEPGLDDRLPALGFFALGPVYYGDPKKLDQIDDRIDAMGRGFLGLTIACARCHDHKFDPIGTADYYALAGVIAGTEYREAPAVPPEVVKAYDDGQAAIKAKEKEIAAFLKSASERLSVARAGETARYLAAAWTLGARPASEADRVAKEAGLDPTALRRWAALLAAASDKSRPQLARWMSLIERREVVEHAVSAPSAVEVEEVARAFQAQVESLLAHRGESTLDDADKALLDDLAGDKGPLAVPKDRLEKSLPDDDRKALAALRAELEKAKKDAPPKYPVIHTLKDGPKPVDMAVLIRGNPATPGPVVPRRFLAILGGEAPFQQGSGRLELARAIASPDNPLTVRVMVNRIWQHHFGRGLVGTPGNFGALGERPSHPELLDYLASRFVASGWSIKAMHRAIMLSATYQQGSQFDSQAHEIDPEDRLLWRMGRRRLEVEAWRDALLAVAGRLDPRLGGPSASVDDPANRRRTFYAAVSRHNLSPLLRLFDFPDPNITSSERTRTTVPLQQLLVLNDELLVQSARALVARLADRPDQDDAARIRRAYLLLFGRPATEDEVRIGRDYLAADDPDGKEAGDLSRWERYAQALLGTNEFMHVD